MTNDLRGPVRIAVICTNCGETIKESRNLSKEEAQKALPGLELTSVFNAPRCKKCDGFEPYRDISVGHRLEIIEGAS